MIKSSNINIDFSFFEQIKNLIWNTNKKIKSFDKWKNSMKKFDIKLPEKTYNQAKNYIKNYIKKVCKVNAQTKYISLNDNFSQIFDDLEEMDISFPNCYEFEKTALLISFILPEIKKIELNNQDIFIKNFKESITKFYILFNVKTIIENLGDKIESSINIKIESNPAEEIEKLIKNTGFRFAPCRDIRYLTNHQTMDESILICGNYRVISRDPQHKLWQLWLDSIPITNILPLNEILMMYHTAAG
jgi:hypothetical protein